jgi:hypothetical protein
MNPADKEEIVEAFEKVLARRSKIDSQTHLTHHEWVTRAKDLKILEWIEHRIKLETERTEFWQNARNKAFFPAIGLLLGAVFVAAWHAVTELFKRP